MGKTIDPTIHRSILPLRSDSMLHSRCAHHIPHFYRSISAEFPFPFCRPVFLCRRARASRSGSGRFTKQSSECVHCGAKRTEHGHLCTGHRVCSATAPDRASERRHHFNCSKLNWTFSLSPTGVYMRRVHPSVERSEQNTPFLSNLASFFLRAFTKCSYTTPTDSRWRRCGVP